MDIHRLDVFCKVVELGSFTRAADAAGLTQPTVSEHIRTLEESLGERLVDRLGREMLPTPAGKILYRYARDIIQLRDEALQALEKFRGNLSGNLLIGASTIPGAYILPELIGAFKNSHPSIQITLKITGTAGVVEGLLDGSHEIGIIGAQWDDRRIIQEMVFSDELILIVHPDHPWTEREYIEPEELLHEPVILRERGSGTRTTMNRSLEAVGISSSQLRSIAEMGSTEAVREGVKARIGVSVLSSRAVAGDLASGSLAAVKIRGITFSRSFYLAERKSRRLSPLCEAFLEHLRAVAGRVGEEDRARNAETS